MEGGVTKGTFENVGCVTQLSTYYAFNNIVGQANDYQEYLIPNGRVDPGDDIEVIIETNVDNQFLLFLTTPDYSGEDPTARINHLPDTLFYVDIGIEGTLSAVDHYSSIPMSKFTNMKIKQNDSWVNFPSSAIKQQVDADEGYIGIKCSSSNGLIAGSIMEINNDLQELDCNNVAVRNQAAIVDNQVIEISVQEDRIIFLNDVDTDQDYLHYYLVSNPTKGILNYTNIHARIPNTDGDSSQIVYTPASSPPENDSFRYSVTDERTGHTREVLISIIGPTPASTIPDPVDDFSYILDGTTINFDWREPFDGGSPIENYKVERSPDTVSWSLHDWYAETSFSYERPEGYDTYFRIFANNANGLSASSNVIHVHIPDSTPPIITINNPNDGETLIVPNVLVDGLIFEGQNSGIEDVKIWLDNILSKPLAQLTKSDH